MRHAVKVVLAVAALALFVELGMDALSIAPGEWIKPVLMVIGGPGLVTAAPLMLVAAVRFRGRAARTEGIVEKCVEEHPGHELTIRFTALDGGEHVFTEEANLRRHVGQPIRIMYDPESPDDARIDGHVGLDVFAAVVMLAVGLVLSYFLWAEYLQG